MSVESWFKKPSDISIMQINQLPQHENFDIGLADFCSIEIEPQVRLSVEKCLSKLNKMCAGCTGDHSIWFIAGGYCAYKMGYTNKYNDIDVYVYCNGTVSQSHDLCSRCLTYPGLGVATFNEFHKITQIIRVNFNWNLTLKSHFTRMQLYALHVIENFDMAICRVMLKFDIHEPVNNDLYTIDVAAIENLKKPASERVSKYAKRMVTDKKRTVPSLKILAARVILKIN